MVQSQHLCTCAPPKPANANYVAPLHPMGSVLDPPIGCVCICTKMCTKLGTMRLRGNLTNHENDIHAHGTLVWHGLRYLFSEPTPFLPVSGHMWMVDTHAWWTCEWAHVHGGHMCMVDTWVGTCAWWARAHGGHLCVMDMWVENQNSNGIFF